MVDVAIQSQLLQTLGKLPAASQLAVLDFARSLQEPQTGTPFSRVRHLIGTLPAEQADAMERAIEEGCERIDRHEW
ncbi:MAG TPA: hypothetical protein VMP01_24890 [Pirellulaceae bacterium]|nr:hypothetical protein [Pirellulaceae bacterium]